MNKIRLVGLFIFFLGFSFLYMNAIISFKLEKTDCRVINYKDYCLLELLNRRNCISDIIRFEECENFSNNIIGCYAKYNKFFGFCRTFLSLHNVYDDYVFH